jgi:hypothetical protein
MWHQQHMILHVLTVYKCSATRSKQCSCYTALCHHQCALTLHQMPLIDSSTIVYSHMQAVEAKCRDLKFAVDEKDAELQEQAVELQRTLDVSTPSHIQVHTHTQYLQIQLVSSDTPGCLENRMAQALIAYANAPLLSSLSCCKSQALASTQEHLRTLQHKVCHLCETYST